MWETICYRAGQTKPLFPQPRVSNHIFVPAWLKKNTIICNGNILTLFIQGDAEKLQILYQIIKTRLAAFSCDRRAIFPFHSSPCYIHLGSSWHCHKWCIPVHRPAHLSVLFTHCRRWFSQISMGPNRESLYRPREQFICWNKKRILIGHNETLP